MSLCKICQCGRKIIQEKRSAFPDNCPSCGRSLIGRPSYNEADPRVKEILGQQETDPEKIIESNGEEEKQGKQKYVLRMKSGKKIDIPDEGGIIGRTGIGGELLSEYQSVSREHLQITPRRTTGVIVEDLSKYGTLIDGKRMEKNSPVMITAGTRITLCGLDLILEEKG